MVFKKHKNVIGGVTVGDMKRILENRDNDDFIYLGGFDFYACEDNSGNIDFRATACKPFEKDLEI